MAAYFFESSALVKRYNSEMGSAWVTSLTDPLAGNIIYIARITGVEVTAAITRRGRLHGLLTPAATAALAQLQSDLSSLFHIIEITPSLLDDAISNARKYALRGYDAVQLSAVLEINSLRLAFSLPAITLVSADTELNAASATEGLSIDDPNLHP